MFLFLSRGEICVANWIPPLNGTSLGSSFCAKKLTSNQKHSKYNHSTVFEAKVVKWGVVYVDQQMHACASVHMVENKEKHSKII